MSSAPTYLYDNKQSNADKRLRGLETVEDANTISLLKDLTDIDGSICLEIGAGAGSIAEWLARRVGASGAVTATDIEPKHLSGSGYEVLQHDIENDELPNNHFDLIHMRHVLIHLVDPIKALRSVHSSMKIGAVILIEESDLSTWKPDGNASEAIRHVFQNGVEAIFSTYESRGMDTRIGAHLSALLADVGFGACRQNEHMRGVVGGSEEAAYQSNSATQLADALGTDDDRAESIRRFANCLLDPELSYESRTTVSISAKRLV